MTKATTQREPAGLVIDHLTKIFGGSVKAIDDVSLTIQPGEMVSFLGPSGCGKTTTLNCIAGLEHPDGEDNGIEHVELAGDQIDGHRIAPVTLVLVDRRANQPSARDQVLQRRRLRHHRSVLPLAVHQALSLGAPRRCGNGLEERRRQGRDGQAGGAPCAFPCGSRGGLT